AGSCIVRVTSVNNPAVFAEVKVSVVDPNKTVTAKTKTADGTTTASQTGGNTETTTAANTAAENTRADMQVIDGITYFDGVMIVNKTYTLPQSYNPGGMTADTRAAFAELQEAAKADGLTITSVSDFRSYETQDTLYHNYVARDGQAAADTFSARAGHSEHQTGMAIDCNWAGDAFNTTPEAKWLAENAWKYGFIVRYPQDKEAITGFKYESWHIRYLGKEWAKKIYDSGLCLEEYFHIDSKYAE
ncbi:MAG: M15 family metallopeptidase, partial [Oscillospiraceae bacterium]|nr:M15 family metallopeptidase [Oscillospiraceae bacterium]